MVSNAKRNAIASYVNTAVTAALGLVINPVLLHGLGATTFGTWKAVQRLLDFGTAADGGASQSLKWVVAHRSSTASDEDKRGDVGAAVQVALMWTPVILSLTAAVVVLLPVLVSGVPESESGSLYWTGAVLALNVCISAFATLPDAVLTGTNQAFRSISVTTLTLLLTNGLMVAAAGIDLGSGGLAASVLVGTLFNGTITLLVARRHVRWWGIKRPHRDGVKSLTKLSGWVWGWGLTNRVLLATEALLIGIFVGVNAVASYTFTSYVLQFALGICLMTSSALMPRLGAHFGAHRHAQAAAVAREARELTIALGAGAASLVILLNGAFVTAWAGASQFLGQPVNILMAVAFLQLSLIRVDGQVQDAALHMKPKVLLGLGMTGLSIALSAALFSLFQTTESLYWGVISGRLLGSIGFPLLANRAMGISSWPVVRLAVASCLTVASALTAPHLKVAGIASLLGFGLAATAIVGAIVWFCLLAKSTRKKVFRRAGHDA